MRPSGTKGEFSAAGICRVLAKNFVNRENYIEKIANGIYNAIISSYETYLKEESK